MVEGLQRSAVMVRREYGANTSETSANAYFIHPSKRVRTLQGKARGNRWALAERSFMQSCMFALGRFIQACWPGVIFFLLLLLFCCFIPLRSVEIELDIVKLWVEGECCSCADLVLSVVAVVVGALQEHGVAS